MRKVPVGAIERQPLRKEWGRKAGSAHRRRDLEHRVNRERICRKVHVFGTAGTAIRTGLN